MNAYLWIALGAGVVFALSILFLRARALVLRLAHGYVPLAILLVLCGCAHTDKVTIYTEEGLRGAEQGWDGYYNAEADRCESLYEPKTPEMEDCFGKTYDVNAAVGKVVRSAVALLQGYWIARAAGEHPDFAEIITQIQTMIDELPPEAKQYFDRVRGIP